MLLQTGRHGVRFFSCFQISPDPVGQTLVHICVALLTEPTIAAVRHRS